MRNNVNKRTKVNKNKSAGGPSYNTLPDLRIGGSVIPRSVHQVMPDRLRTRLSYNGLDVITIAIGASTSSRRWIPTGLFDIDPLIGSTATVGFSELAAFYKAYRVHSSRFRIRLTPNTTATVPCQVVIIPLNQDPGASPSVTTIQEWMNNPYAKHKLSGGYGAQSVSVTQEMSTQKLYGSEMVLFDDAFASLTTTNPTNNWYWAVGVGTPSLIAGAAAVYTIEIGIEMEADFYDRTNLNS